MKQLSDDDIAVRVLDLFRGQDAGRVLSAIARVAASTVIGGACNRDELYAAIDSFLDVSAN